MIDYMSIAIERKRDIDQRIRSLPVDHPKRSHYLSKRLALVELISDYRRQIRVQEHKNE